MSTPLHVLFVEDSEDDVVQLVRELRRGGYSPTYERVETAEAMTAALEQRGDWELIISDYKMPHFSAEAALDLIHRTGRDLPFIMVSGVVGEDEAVAAMRAGAHDYIMKSNLARLVPAIERELSEAQRRCQQRGPPGQRLEGASRRGEVAALIGRIGVAGLRPGRCRRPVKQPDRECRANPPRPGRPSSQAALVGHAAVAFLDSEFQARPRPRDRSRARFGRCKRKS